MHEQIDEKAELGFQSNNTERRSVELDFLFEIRVRRMIRTQDRQGPVGDSLQQRLEIYPRSQRRIHFVIRIEILDRLVGQCDVMRANFAANFYPARSRFAKQSHTSGCSEMLAMNRMIA